MREPPILARLLAHDPGWKGPGSNARCPGPTHANGDRNPSLSVRLGHDGRALLRCHAGCATADVVKVLGGSMSELFADGGAGTRDGRARTETRYEIRDRDGLLHAVKVRVDGGKRGKSYRLEHPPDASKNANGPTVQGGVGVLESRRLPLFGSERLGDFPCDAVRVVCEGEKAANVLLGLGILAMGTVTGAATCPGPEALAVLEGADVVLWPDNDEVGRKHAREIAAVKVRPARSTSGSAKQVHL